MAKKKRKKKWKWPCWLSWMRGLHPLMKHVRLMHLQHRHRLHKNNSDDALHLSLFFSLNPKLRVSIEAGDSVLWLFHRGRTGLKSRVMLHQRDNPLMSLWVRTKQSFKVEMVFLGTTIQFWINSFTHSHVIIFLSSDKGSWTKPWVFSNLVSN